MSGCHLARVALYLGNASRRALLFGAMAVVAASCNTVDGAVGAAQQTARGGIAFTDVADVVDRVADAKSVIIATYELSPRSTLLRAIAAAAARGAHVDVVLSGSAFGAARVANESSMQLLAGDPQRCARTQHSRAMCRVWYSAGADHLKIAIVDQGRGPAVFLSDRNFASQSRAELVIRDEIAKDRPILERAIYGIAGSDDHLWTTKGTALKAEATIIRQRRTRSLSIATESFGSSSLVYRAIFDRARAGDHVRLIVARLEYSRSIAERRAVAALEAAGVTVRVGGDEKMAVDGPAVWIGSANASGAGRNGAGSADQLDWGMAFISDALAQHVQRQFDADWAYGADAT